MEGWAGYAKATSIAGIIFSLAASALLVLKPISVPSLAIYGPFVTLVAASVLTAMQLCNVALSFYIVGVQYWSVFVFVVNGVNPRTKLFPNLDEIMTEKVYLRVNVGEFGLLTGSGLSIKNAPKSVRIRPLVPSLLSRNDCLTHCA